MESQKTWVCSPAQPLTGSHLTSESVEKQNYPAYFTVLHWRENYINVYNIHESVCSDCNILHKCRAQWWKQYFRTNVLVEVCKIKWKMKMDIRNFKKPLTLGSYFIEEINAIRHYGEKVKMPSVIRLALSQLSNQLLRFCFRSMFPMRNINCWTS